MTLGPTSWVINSCYCPFNISNLIPVSAFTESGEFYSWGNYGYCQLGNEIMNQSLNPALVQNSLLGRNVVLPREEGVRLGIQHAAWTRQHQWQHGRLRRQQLWPTGDRNKANLCTPTKVGEDLGRIVEIAATNYNHISATLTQDSWV